MFNIAFFVLACFACGRAVLSKGGDSESFLCIADAFSPPVSAS